MGRITVFSLEDCPHCIRVKSAFTERGIPFVEIDLSSYPGRRSDMLSLSDRLTVPQVFFNGAHVGGADDTIAVLNKWDRGLCDDHDDGGDDDGDGENKDAPASASAALDRYRSQVESEDDPSDPRLVIPAGPPPAAAAASLTAPRPGDTEEDWITLPTKGRGGNSRAGNGSIGSTAAEAGAEAESAAESADRMSVLDVTRLLMTILPHGDKARGLCVYKNALTATDCAIAVADHFELESEDGADALAFCGMLVKRKILRRVHPPESDDDDDDDDNHNTDDENSKNDCGFGNVVNDGGGGDGGCDGGCDGTRLFRLQPFHTPMAINTFRMWPSHHHRHARRAAGSGEAEAADVNVDANADANEHANVVDSPDPMALILRLKKQLSRIVAKFTDPSGMTNYRAAYDDDAYWQFEEDVCELQTLENLGNLTKETRLAFWINLYNLMIVHAFIKVGVPAGPSQRSDFYGKVSYQIGKKHKLSLSELEHGILRSNSRAPYTLSRPFPSSDRVNDERITWALDTVDPRLHFALNCGAKSCPPIKTYTSEAIEEELRIVSMSFCESDDNVRIDENRSEVRLSMIFNWYRLDFCPTSSELPKKVVSYLRGEKKETLNRMLNDKSRTISVKFAKYDWSINASEVKSFDPSALCAYEMRLKVMAKSVLPLFPFSRRSGGDA